jgi:cell shape-determining protein MreC
VVLAGSRVTESDSGSVPALCGIVREVSLHTAEVLTLVGSEATVAARLESSDAVGFINADSGAAVPGDMRTRLNFLPANREYMAGEPVVTAGFEENIPAGILIGYVTDILGANTVYDNRLYVNALVRPAADFENIRFLVILTRQ